MAPSSLIRPRALALALALVAAVSAQKPAAPAKAATGAGTITLITGFTAFSEPYGLVEVSPGTFAGLAAAPTQPGPHAFTMTSKGVLNSLYTFPANTLLSGPLIQAVNGRLYADWLNQPSADFSLNLSGQIRTYPPTATQYAPTLSIQLPDGSLYGTERDVAGPTNNAFVQMTLTGAATILHTFSAQEGKPFGAPILGSDGNFYGISTLGSSLPAHSTSAMVYRLKPGGDLTILATYPDGRNYYAPGAFQESLIQASNGNLYGTAALGGSKKSGAIFQLSLDGTYTALYEFNRLATGAPTFLIEGTDHNLYGVAQGMTSLGGGSSLFRITLAGQFNILQRLNGSQIGTCPCWLTIGSDGKFYGTTIAGGPGQGAAWTWDLGLPPPQPDVTGVVPTSGSPGTVVTVNGKFLLGATGVSFNGTPATVFSNISGNYVSATVPPSATTGPITVTTANGSSTSAGSFTVE